MARPGAPRPYDLASLVERAGTAGAHQLAARLRVSGSTLLDLAVFGLTEDQADVFATRVGLHPGEVWPRWWEIDDYAGAAGDGKAA